MVQNNSSKHGQSGRTFAITSEQRAQFVDASIRNVLSEEESGHFKPTVTPEEWATIFPGTPKNDGAIKLLPADIQAGFARAAKIAADAAAPTTRAPLPEFVDFIEDLRKGRVRSHDKAFPKEAFHRWNYPVYDFGYLLDPQHADYIAEDILEAMIDAGVELGITPTEYYGRDPTCIFMFKCVDPDHGTISHIVRINNQDTVQTESFVHDIELDYWLNVPITEYIGNCVARASFVLRTWYEDAIIKTITSDKATKVSRKRKLNGQPSIQPTRVIHLSKQRVQRVRQEQVERQTGERAAPGQHTRTITDNWIFPKKPGGRQFKPYQRKPKIVVVNPHRPLAHTYQTTANLPVIHEVRR